MRKFALEDSSPEAPGQLYDLSADPGERRNLWLTEVERRRRMEALLGELTGAGGRTAPRGRTPLGMEFVREASGR